MNQKVRTLALFVLFVAIVGVIFSFLAPRHIVDDVDDSRITRVLYNPHFDQQAQVPEDIVEITDYDEAAILACLNRYSERGVLAKASSTIWTGDVELSIDFDRGEESRYLLLGNLDYSYAGEGTTKYYVAKADALRLELLELLGLPPQS